MSTKYTLEYAHIENIELEKKHPNLQHYACPWQNIVELSDLEEIRAFKVRLESHCESWVRYRIVEITKKVLE